MYKDEIYNLSLAKTYSNTAYMYSGGGLPNSEIEVTNDPKRMQYAILDKDQVIGYFTYFLDYENAKADGFGLISFTDKPNLIIGLDVKHEVMKILRNKRIHKLSWWSSGENPAISGYTKFCKMYNGDIHRLKDHYINKDGEFCDTYIFEIVKR